MAGRRALHRLPRRRRRESPDLDERLSVGTILSTIAIGRVAYQRPGIA
jgi:hypothetical protein